MPVTRVYHLSRQSAIAAGPVAAVGMVTFVSRLDVLVFKVANSFSSLLDPPNHTGPGTPQ